MAADSDGVMIVQVLVGDAERGLDEKLSASVLTAGLGGVLLETLLSALRQRKSWAACD